MTSEHNNSPPPDHEHSDGPGLMYKGSLLTLVIMAFVVPLALAAVPFIDFFNGMAAQPKGKTQMTFGRTYGLATMVEREPVPGTLPRGHVPVAFTDVGNTIEEAKAIGATLRSPFAPSMERIRNGQKSYEVFCIVCHGKTGAGDGSVVGPDRFPAPPSLHTEQARGYDGGTLFFITSKGVAKMPPYANMLSVEERWEIVHYLRALQRSINPRPEDLQR